MTKKLLSIILSLALCLSLLPTAALAAPEYVASVIEADGKTTNYTTINVAQVMAQESAGSTLKLLKNHTGSVSINSGTVTLDLNGCTISSNAYAVIINGGTVTITDSRTDQPGRIEATGDFGCGVCNQGSGTVTISGSASITGSMWGVINKGSGTVTISGGKVAGRYAAQNEKGTMEITGGTITGGDTGVYNIESNSNAGLTITGGTISGGTYGVDNSGTLTVSGAASITGTSAAISYRGGTVDLSDWTNADGAKIYSDTSDVEVSDGSTTFKLPAGHVLLDSSGAEQTKLAYLQTYTVDKLYNVTIADDITNGTITADKTNAAAGETVTLTAAPEMGYELDTLTVTDANGNPVTVIDNKFTMPEGDVAVIAQWKPIEFYIVLRNSADPEVELETTYIKATYGEELDMSKHSFFRPGYTLTGWNSQGEGGGSVSCGITGEDAIISANEIAILFANAYEDEELGCYCFAYLTARWVEENVNGFYIVLRGSAEGTPDKEYVWAKRDRPLDMSEYQNRYSREGYVLTGWNSKGDGTGSVECGADGTITAEQIETLFANAYKDDNGSYYFSYLTAQWGCSHSDTDGDHYCDRDGCGEHLRELCTDADGDHACETCSTVLEDLCKDEDPIDHKCDNANCANVLSNCKDIAGNDNVCDTCGKGIYPDPGDLNMQTVPGDGQITVTWDALDDVGEDTVQSYTVYCYVDDYDDRVTAEYTGAGSHTFTGLTNGVEYSVGVDAEYSSEYSVGYEDCETPTDALKIKTVAAEKGSLTVNWTKPERDGTITGYEVTVARADDPSRGTTVNAGADAVSCTVDNLAGGTTYTVAVRVTYKDGDRIDSAPADVKVPFHVANIWVGEVRVTDDNKKDVLGDADEGATVTYDPDNNTLTLTGAAITGGYEYGDNSFAGIYAVGDLNIVLGDAESSVTVSTDATATESYGIFVIGDLSVSGSGSLTAAGGAATGDNALSAGILVTDDLTLKSGSVTAVGKEAVATGLGFSAGVYTMGNLALNGGSLTATADSAKGYFAQSNGVFTEGAFTMYDGSLTATGGTAVSDAEGAYATSIGIFTTETYSMWGGSVTAVGGAAKGPAAYSAGISAKSDLSLHDGSLTANGGTAEGDYAFSAGIEIAGLTGEYLKLNVYGGSMEATGGAAVGVTEAESAGVYAERSDLYIYNEDGNPVVKLTGGSARVTSENAADEPYASSNGIFVSAGDVDIDAGEVTITGGSWVGSGGNGWAVYVTEYADEGGYTSGGRVTIDCTEVTLNSYGYGFNGTTVTITGVNTKNGYAIYARGGITIGDTLAISNPAGAIIGNTEWGDMILESAEEGADPAKIVTIEPLVYTVTIKGLSYDRAVEVLAGKSVNEIYCESLGVDDFSEAMDTEKSGYIFRGFYTEDGSKYDFDDKVTADVTITARWEAEYYDSYVPTTSTTTTKNEDGSTTTTTTNKSTGTVTETTKYPDGSSTTVVTTKDGAVTTTGKTADGVTGVTKIDADGTVTGVTATVPTAAAKDAEKTGEAVTLPIEVEAADDTDDAVEIEIDIPSGGAKVEIPVEDVTPGTVVAIVNKDGTEEIVKTSTVSENGVVVTLDKDATVKVIDNSKQFVDVHPVDHWATDAVDFVVAREIYSGTSATTFHPDNAMTRGMLAVVLHRLENTPDHNYTGSFTDVAEDSWYEDAIHWAADNGIVGGYGNGLYGPNDNITREQLAVMLWRYAGSPDSDHSLDHFVDKDQISSFAEQALAWANENGIINGKGNNILDPKGDATRAQVAQMLKNFMQNLL